MATTLLFPTEFEDDTKYYDFYKTAYELAGATIYSSKTWYFTPKDYCCGICAFIAMNISYYSPVLKQDFRGWIFPTPDRCSLGWPAGYFTGRYHKEFNCDCERDKTGRPICICGAQKKGEAFYVQNTTIGIPEQQLHTFIMTEITDTNGSWMDWESEIKGIGYLRTQFDSYCYVCNSLPKDIFYSCKQCSYDLCQVCYNGSDLSNIPCDCKTYEDYSDGTCNMCNKTYIHQHMDYIEMEPKVPFNIYTSEMAVENLKKKNDKDYVTDAIKYEIVNELIEFIETNS